MKVAVKNGPVADFSFTNLCFRDTVRFTPTPVANNFTFSNYLWTFHDNTTQNTINAKKLYPATGNYDVRLRIYTTNGCVADTTKTITINSGNIPSLTIVASGKPCVDSSINFTSSITPNANNAATWYWDFGDGQTATSSTSNIVTHSYSPAATNITVKNLVTLSQGCSPDTVRYTIPVINPNPVASFTIIKDTLCTGKPVVFTSSATGVSIWKWNFGNGTGTQIPSFNYTYNNAGTFNVSLIVTDANGCSSLPANDQVIISPSPNINAGADKLISLGTSTTIDATITNAANYTFTWTPSVFLDAANILNPISTPDTTVTYTILAIDKVSHCFATDKVIISPISKLYIPTAFTPNNDGRNDTWKIPGLALYPEARVTVFNRGGEKIFEAKGYSGAAWTGMYKGLIQPNGVYVYLIELNDDKKQVLKGTLTLIR
jgi:gliding motility-associated-like protein